jgi:hypothetical protein
MYFLFVKKKHAMALFVWLISHQPTVLFSHNKPASSTLLSEQTSTSHQPPANRKCCRSLWRSSCQIACPGQLARAKTNNIYIAIIMPGFINLTS